MMMIDLSEWMNYDKRSMMALLKTEESNCYEIIIRRNIKLKYDVPRDAYMEFGVAAYLGHLLSMLSEEFSYDVPCRFNNKPFRFIVRSRQYGPLANIFCDACREFFDVMAQNERFMQALFEHERHSQGNEFYPAAAGLVAVVQAIRREDYDEIDLRKKR